MANKYYDLTDAEVESIKDAAAGGDIANKQDIEDRIFSVNRTLSSPVSYVESEVVSGVLTLERRTQFTYYKIDTEGSTSLDQITQINATANTDFFDGDRIFLYQLVPSRVLQFQTGGNLQLNRDQIELGGDGHYLQLIYKDGVFSQVDSYPSTSENLNIDQAITYTPIVGLIDPVLKSANLLGGLNTLTSVISSETLARATVTVTGASGGAGTPGIWTVYVDEGSGAFAIGTALDDGLMSRTQVRDAMETAINAGSTGYTATASGSFDLFIDAPIGTGATGNSYVLSNIATGLVTVSIGSNFTGGIDGTYTDESLITANLLNENGYYIIRNGMSANTITISDGDNINANIVLQASEIAHFIYDGSNLQPFKPYSLGALDLSNIKVINTATYSALKSDAYLHVDYTATGACRVTLPTLSASDLLIFQIKDSGFNASVNNITIDTAGTELIDGSASVTLTSSKSALTIYSYNGNYFIK